MTSLKKIYCQKTSSRCCREHGLSFFTIYVYYVTFCFYLFIAISKKKKSTIIVRYKKVYVIDKAFQVFK